MVEEEPEKRRAMLSDALERLGTAKEVFAFAREE